MKTLFVILIAVFTATFSFGQSFYSEVEWSSLDSIQQEEFKNIANETAFGTDIKVSYTSIIYVKKVLNLPSSRGGKDFLNQYEILGLVSNDTIKSITPEIPCVPDNAMTEDAVKTSLCRGFKWGDDEY